MELTIYIKIDLALNNLQRLICHKKNPTIPTNQQLNTAERVILQDMYSQHILNTIRRMVYIYIYIYIRIIMTRKSDKHLHATTWSTVSWRYVFPTEDTVTSRAMSLQVGVMSPHNINLMGKKLYYIYLNGGIDVILELSWLENLTNTYLRYTEH